MWERGGEKQIIQLCVHPSVSCHSDLDRPEEWPAGISWHSKRTNANPVPQTDLTSAPYREQLTWKGLGEQAPEEWAPCYPCVSCMVMFHACVHGCSPCHPVLLWVFIKQIETRWVLGPFTAQVFTSSGACIKILLVWLESQVHPSQMEHHHKLCLCFNYIFTKQVIGWQSHGYFLRQGRGGSLWWKNYLTMEDNRNSFFISFIAENRQPSSRRLLRDSRENSQPFIIWGAKIWYATALNPLLYPQLSGCSHRRVHRSVT